MPTPIEEFWWILAAEEEEVADALEAEGIEFNGFINRMPILKNLNEMNRAKKIAWAVKFGQYSHSEEKPKKRRRGRRKKGES